MKIKRVLIKNYRSIKTLEFYPNSICALVGENNAGKSNILAALNLLLGEVWPSKRSLEPSDYFEQNFTQPIHIEVEFHDNPSNIKQIWFTAPWEDQTETKIQFFGNDTPYNLKSEWRERCALVCLDANRNLEYHMGHSSWMLFGRIIRRLDEDFRAQADADMQLQLRRRFEEARDLLCTDLFREFDSTIKDCFRQQIRRTTHRVELEFQTFDPLNYYRAIHLLLWENEQQKTPTESGQGMRNMILLALFRTYAKVFKEDAIIAIEEPEIYLHPHSQRSLFGLFCDLAEQEAQVFYSTHSSSFVDIEHFDRICLVEKKAEAIGNVVHYHTAVKQVSPEHLLKIRQRLHENVAMTIQSLRERYRNICTLAHNEAFFAKKIVLVEGDTEESSLPLFAKALGYDFDTYGVTIVNAASKNNLDQLYQLFDAFGIPIYLIFDGDRRTNDQDKLNANELLLQMLGEIPVREPEEVITDRYAIFEKEFETTLRRELDLVYPGLYEHLHNEAGNALGGGVGKGLRARYITKRLVEMHPSDPRVIPAYLHEIIDRIRNLGSPLAQGPETTELLGEDEILF
jgi:putative ATP-dependent endonuclease of OLD family